MTRNELNEKLSGSVNAIGIRVNPDNRNQVIDKLEDLGFKYEMNDGLQVIVVYHSGIFESYSGVLDDYTFDDEVSVECILA